jgi:hypothetical protein
MLLWSILYMVLYLMEIILILFPAVFVMFCVNICRIRTEWAHTVCACTLMCQLYFIHQLLNPLSSFDFIWQSDSLWQTVQMISIWVATENLNELFSCLVDTIKGTEFN